MTLTIDILLSGLILGGMYALTALGLTLQYGVARIMNLSYGEFLIAAAFVAYWLFAGWLFAGVSLDGAAVHANANSNAMFQKDTTAVDRKLADGLKAKLIELSKDAPPPVVVMPAPNVMPTPLPPILGTPVRP